jgi:hypothetical protein
MTSSILEKLRSYPQKALFAIAQKTSICPGSFPLKLVGPSKEEGREGRKEGRKEGTAEEMAN